MKAKPTTFTVPEVPGSKRKTHNAYSHALIGQFDNDAQRARILSSKNIDRLRAEWQTIVRNAANRIGNCAETVAKYRTEDNYVAFWMITALQQTPKDRLNPLSVLRWSFSAKNAAAGIAEFTARGFVALRVVDVVAQ